MPPRTATGRPDSLPRLSALRLLPLLFLAAGCQIPPDLLHMPRYIWDSFTNPNFVVNAPVIHDLLGVSRGLPDEDTQRARFRLPPGFVMNVYAEGVTLARFMRVTPVGDVIVSQPRKQRVLLLTRDEDADGRADDRRILLEDLNLPHGVELVDDQLYVAGPGYIVRVGFDIEAGQVRGEPEVFAELPGELGHANRPLRLGPDGWLYTAIGANCNVCEPTSPREQTILRFDLSSGREEIVASGFRNAAHFDWRPEDNAMYATEVGADYQGENFPLEELNRIEPRRFYGFPYLHGPDHRDPELAAGNEGRIRDATPPVHTFTAHSTPLGITFLRNGALPPEYRNAALVSLKGSWNRERKSGYKVVSLHWSEAAEDPRIEQREFLVGFERDEHVIGRPVDIVEGPDGSLFLSDEMAGAVYRIRYAGEALADPGTGNENRFALRFSGAAGAPEARPSIASIDGAERAALSEAGEALFARHTCGQCHSAGDSRSASVPLEGLATRRTLEEVIDLLRTPPASMPRFLLTAHERRALSVYLLSRFEAASLASRD